MITYAGNNVFPTAITEVSGGAPATSASVNVPLEGLADRTVWLKTRSDESDGSSIRNLRVPLFNDVAAAAFDFAFTRPDGTCPAFWAPQFFFWIKPGKNTAGSLYAGDNGSFVLIGSGATTPPKTSFGCGGTRTCLFDSTQRTLAGGVDLEYVQGPAVGLDVSDVWTTRTLDTVASYISNVQAGDAIVTELDTMIVVGGGNISSPGEFIVWRSTDGGTTFSRILLGAVTLATTFLSRVICGASNRLVTWTTLSAANLGNMLFYSDDDGATWASRSAIGFANITDGVYLADLDLWAFLDSSTSTVYTTPDPVAGAFTAHTFGTLTITSMGGFGHYLVLGATFTSGWQLVILSTDGLTTSTFIERPVAGDVITSVSASSAQGQVLLQTSVALTLSDKV